MNKEIHITPYGFATRSYEVKEKILEALKEFCIEPLEAENKGWYFLRFPETGERRWNIARELSKRLNVSVVIGLAKFKKANELRT